MALRGSTVREKADGWVCHVPVTVYCSCLVDHATRHRPKEDKPPIALLLSIQHLVTRGNLSEIRKRLHWVSMARDDGLPRSLVFPLLNVSLLVLMEETMLVAGAAEALLMP
ncbi:hypothetical protein MUK42_00422 [Musa troglodytarum]|uniref:Uncharacterized protein n=1 Tax=Musa troglodytarum TaxID=320322 RepID=A0A9E7JRL6_9LILI|nr:hypothetical protein MUK42_00422 [Musa troglodytarum]